MNINGKDLTYCLNIHPGETLAEVKKAISTHAALVKERVSPEKPFGLGLRLSNQAALELEPKTAEFSESLKGQGMYVFTVNGFPYGKFHDTLVKNNVYLPDWSVSERLDYTMRLARIIADLLPERGIGTISTVPVSQGKHAAGAAIDNLLKIDRELANIQTSVNRRIKLALEPEPGCLLETAGECVEFWKRYLHNTEHIGICLDTCHFSINFETPLSALRYLIENNVPVFKVQISSALRLPTLGGRPPSEVLSPFISGVYLHQVRIKENSTGKIFSFADVPQALDAGINGEWRLHFHVPLHWSGRGELETTRNEITSEFLSEAALQCSHFEVETYTFSLMPGTMQSVEDSIAAEIKWVKNRFNYETA